MNKVGIIMLGGDKQQICFWPSYYNCDSGYPHDLIIIHRNKLGLPKEMNNKYGKLFIHNKIDNNGNDVPHRAFGAYRHFYQMYKDKYDIFIFISDDVVIKRDNWLLDIINTLNIHDKLGFGASQIFNGGKNYPHESHIRAPFWFAKKEALSKIKWEFNNDHDGEMKIGNQLTDAGYFGVQIGNKLDLGFDSTEKDHITQLLEKKLFPTLSPFGKYEVIGELERMYYENKVDKNIEITSPFPHIRNQKIYNDLEPFNNLIYLPGLDIAKKYVSIKDVGFNINVLDSI